MMFHRPGLAPTTHTVTLSQVAQINARLAGQMNRRHLTADDLGIKGAILGPGDDVSKTAVLIKLTCSGSPTWPRIYAHFAVPGARLRPSRVEIHTSTLRLLSKRLRLRQVWGF